MKRNSSTAIRSAVYMSMPQHAQYTAGITSDGRTIAWRTKDASGNKVYSNGQLTGPYVDVTDLGPETFHILAYAYNRGFKIAEAQHAQIRAEVLRRLAAKYARQNGHAPTHRRNVSTLTAAAAGFVGGAIAERRLGLIKKVVSNPGGASKSDLLVKVIDPSGRVTEQSRENRYGGLTRHDIALDMARRASVGSIVEIRDPPALPGGKVKVYRYRVGRYGGQPSIESVKSGAKRNPEPWAPRQTRMPPSKLTAASAPGWYVVTAKGSYLSGPWTTAAKAASAYGASRAGAQIKQVSAKRNPRERRGTSVTTADGWSRARDFAEFKNDARAAHAYGTMIFYQWHAENAADKAKLAAAVDRLQHMGFNQWGVMIWPLARQTYLKLAKKRGVRPEWEL